jgi:hypothetical protein
LQIILSIIFFIIFFSECMVLMSAAGTIGGFEAIGIIGLFVGGIVLSANRSSRSRQKLPLLILWASHRMPVMARRQRFQPVYSLHNDSLQDCL